MKLSKIIFFLFCGISSIIFGQQEVQKSISLSFHEAIQKASNENIAIRASKIEELVASSELKDAKAMAFPKIGTAATYQRYSKITVYDGFFGDSHQISKPPNSNVANLGVEGFFNLYNGNKQKNSVKIASYKNKLAAINTDENTANISVQVAEEYLDLVRLLFLKRIIKEQITRGEKRLDNIKALYQNGKVTKSDLLRAELMLSKVVLDNEAAINDYQITNKKLNVLINFPESEIIIPSDTTFLKEIDEINIDAIYSNNSTPYLIQKNEKFIEISETQKKIIKAGNLPSLALIGGYSFNYPNNLILPPGDQSYSSGFFGARLSFDISSIYQNKHKISAANYRTDELKMQNKYVAENIQQQKESLYIKYKEALNKIEVTEKSIIQAKANYNIINTKYFNQLALLTDLLDADNLYQQSKYDHMQAQIYTILLNYKMLYITGKL